MLPSINLDEAIAQDKRNRETYGLVVTLLLFAALLVGFLAFPLPQADAAKRNVYKGTVTICYAPAAKVSPDQYLVTQWNLAAAVKAAGPSIGKVRVVKERYPLTTCNGEVFVYSTTDAYANRTARPYDVDTYGEAGVMWSSTVAMGDRVGAKATAAQRQAWLVAALKTAIPR